jgi:hypothetical protein
MKGNATPNKVIVLSDVYCGSAWDSFVETCKLSDKVAVLGSTMQTNEGNAPQRYNPDKGMESNQ